MFVCGNWYQLFDTMVTYMYLTLLVSVEIDGCMSHLYIKKNYNIDTANVFKCICFSYLYSLLFFP